MTLEDIRGVYSPAYFGIRINTEQDLHPLEKLSPALISTYFHEYFHFLQDITTRFGFNSALNTYDRTIRLIEQAQKTKGDLQIPLTDKALIDELRRNFKVYSHIVSSKVPLPAITNQFTIKSVTLTAKPELESLVDESVNKFVKMELVDDTGTEAVFWFGGIAVMETMTYIIQGKFFDTSHAPTFPYKSALILAHHLSEQFRGNLEFTFALCEVALLSPYPGRTFYEILMEIEAHHIKIVNADQIYTFGFEHITLKWGLWDKLESDAKRLIGVIEKLYGHEAFIHDREWLMYILAEGARLRKERHSFMLELYRSNSAFSPLLLEISARVGAPEAMNTLNKRWFSAPVALRDKEDKINSVFLLGFKQIQNLLLFGKKECVIINHCEGSERPMPIDSNCIRSPWLKAGQPQLCPFAAIWTSFGLDEKKVIT